MKKPTFLRQTLFTISILLVSTIAYSEPTNLSLLKNEIKIYHDTGLYERELADAIFKAENFILKQAAKTGPKSKLAIVLDVDETSLSNYDKLVKRDFIADQEQFHKDILAANAPVIRPMLDLFTHARQQGIAVFFVTGRPQLEFEATKINLLRAGYKDWAGLYLRPNDYHENSIRPYKTQIRKAIIDQGYTIIASIGDQYSDIDGGYCQKGFKLPNPFYYLP